ncbi:MAG: RNB domain-containing ribonuclease [Proteobacteria bacterium]|nr:RNB domain-containing ribonuclease [Pseudomonadota bacterium]
MKALHDPDSRLSDGLVAIRAQFKVPAAFPPEVEAAAAQAAQRQPGADHVDRTAMPFVTLDPASSTDLDQAFTIEAAGPDLLLHYAIADVAFFVSDGDPVDREAWARGETIYLPDGKAGLYPRVLSEGAASLLPDGPRPAVIFTTSIAPDGSVKLQGVERAVIRSRAKLAYETATDADLPAGFADLAARIAAAEQRRGAARVDPPEQEVERDADGHYTLRLRPLEQTEIRNAALSLASNLAVADALYAAKTGLFRVMAGPDDAAVVRLRHTAQAFGLDWPAAMDLKQFEAGLDQTKPAEAAFMLAVRRAGNGASYVPYQEGVRPWHAAMAATYCHSTAPLRRLADRYVNRAALEVANGRTVPPEVEAAFHQLGPVMGKAEARGSQIDRAVIDLAETAILAGQEGKSFPAVVIDVGDSGTRFQLCDLPVVARTTARGVAPGDKITVRLVSVDPIRRELAFARIA